MSCPLRVIAPLLVALLPLASACDEGEDETLYPRDLTAYDEPVPGKGGCEGCVTGFSRAGNGVGTLYVRLDTRYTGVKIAKHDDANPLQGTTWHLYGTEPDTEPGPRGEPTPKLLALCAGVSCDASRAVSPYPGHAKLRVKLNGKTAAPTHIRVTAIGEYELGGNGIWVTISDDIGEIPTDAFEAQYAAPPIATTDPITRAMVHITYPADGGGVRSCSGSMVSSRHVLTAAHCFKADPDPDPDPPSNLPQGAAYTLPVPPGLDVRIGGLHSPDNPAFAGDERHGAVKIYAYHDKEADLAIVELDCATSVTPLSRAAPGLAAQKVVTTFSAYGYGVSGIPAGSDQAYDWGWLKRTTLKKFAVQSTAMGTSMIFVPPTSGIGICRGDSGGPVIRTVGTTNTLVGVILARVVANPENPDEEEIEYLSRRGFGFSRYNDCGKPSPLWYIAANLENPSVRTWIDGRVNASDGVTQCPYIPEPPGPAPATE